MHCSCGATTKVEWDRHDTVPAPPEPKEDPRAIFSDPRRNFSTDEGLRFQASISQLLPEPAPLVVREAIREIERLRGALLQVRVQLRAGTVDRTNMEAYVARVLAGEIE